MERASCPFYAAFCIVVQAFNNSPRFVLNSRNRCECITLSNAAFASRSTRCPYCFSSVNILHASSTGRAAFMGDDPFVSPLCVGFCILWINVDDLTNYRQNCYSSIVDGIVFASDVKRCTLSYFASVLSSETMDRSGWQYGSKRLGMVYWTQHVRTNQIELPPAPDELLKTIYCRCNKLRFKTL